MGTPSRLAVARVRALSMWPYVSDSLCALTPVLRPGLGTLAVDAGYRLYADVEILAQWGAKKSAGVLLHEVSHLLRGHHARFDRIKPLVAASASGLISETALVKLWNIAADAEINDDLIAESVELPAGAVTPKSLGLPDGKTAEEYFWALLDRLEREQRQESGEGSGEGTAGEQKPGDAPGESSEVSSADAIAKAIEDLAPGHKDCGSCAGGPAREYEEAPDSAEAPVLGEAAQTLIRRITAQKIERAAAAKGNVPGGWVRWAKAELTPPKIPWQRVLAAQIRDYIASARGMSEYTYSRPSRRSSGGIVRPALHEPVVEVAVVLDTSGSMSEGLLTEALSEVTGVLRAARTGATFLAVDAAVHTCKRILRPEEAKRLLAGGGDTDMEVGIARAVSLRPRPDVVVVLTDGYTDWPQERIRGVRVVAGIVGTGSGDPPAWIKTVHVSKEQTS